MLFIPSVPVTKAECSHFRDHCVKKREKSVRARRPYGLVAAVFTEGIGFLLAAGAPKGTTRNCTSYRDIHGYGEVFRGGNIGCCHPVPLGDVTVGCLLVYSQ